MAAAGHANHHGGANHEHHGPGYYVKIWGILLVLLVISIAGPMLGNKILTLVTGFGIAIVKAVLVGAHFMHLKIEKKFVSYILFTMLLAMGLFFVAVSPDVMKTSGRNWTNQAAENLIQHYAKGGGDHGQPHHQ